MKKFVLVIITLVFINLNGFSQQYAVATHDTIECGIGESVTVNVLENSYHVDNLDFWVDTSYCGYPFTVYSPTQITFTADYKYFYNYSGSKTTRFSFRLIDENGKFDQYSTGVITIRIINNYYDTLNRNNIEAPVVCYGNHFWRGRGYLNYNGDTSLHYTFPKGSKKILIYNSTFYIGGIDQNNNLKISAERYRSSGIDFLPGPINVINDTLSTDNFTICNWSRIWKLDIEEVQYHIDNYNKPGYRAIPEILSWPAHGDVGKGQAKYIAPFVDVDGDGFYRPLRGDYPLIKGDQCAFFVFNDLNLENRESVGSSPIGIEVHGMMYQFEDEDNLPVNNTTFLSYKIFNRSEHTLSDTYIGIFFGIDVGYGYDDYVGCDVSRGMYFGYNGEEVDGQGESFAYGENPPAIGVVFLGGPYINSNGFDDPDGGCDESINGKGFGDGIIDNERYGMTGFLFHINPGVYGDPQCAEDYYNHLKMRWRDSTEVQYGGYPSPISYGPSCKFMYPGLSDPCNWGTGGVAPNGPVDWTELNANNGEPNWPDDRRGLGSCGPFTFKPGDVQKIDIAYVAARGDDGPLSSLDLLRVYADTLNNRFAQNTDDFGTQYLGVNEAPLENQSLKVYPNPVSDILTVVIPKVNASSNFVLYNIYGEKVMQQCISSSQKKLNLNLGNLPDGVYVASVISAKQNATKKIIKKE